MSSPTRPPITIPLGQVVLTTNAAKRLTPREIDDGLRRHASGDWGDPGPADAAENDLAVRNGGGFLSAYGTGNRRFWIITEADRSVTTVLLPEDY
jgi:hypothetical protein